MAFKIFIDPENDTDPTDTRYNRHDDDTSQLKGLPSQPVILDQQPLVQNISPFKVLPDLTRQVDPNRSYIYMR